VCNLFFVQYVAKSTGRLVDKRGHVGHVSPPPPQDLLLYQVFEI
jgi:hypothetical protein